MTHGHTRARQYSDQMQCAACGKAWDVNDPDPPPCVVAAPPQERFYAILRPLPPGTLRVRLYTAAEVLEEARAAMAAQGAADPTGGMGAQEALAFAFCVLRGEYDVFLTYPEWDHEAYLRHARLFGIYQDALDLIKKNPA